MRRLFLGPIALLVVFGASLRRRFYHWRLVRVRREEMRRTALRRSSTNLVRSTNMTPGLPVRSLSGRLALVGTRDVRRRGPSTRLLRAPSAEMTIGAQDAVIGNLRRCLSPAAVGAVLDDINNKGLCRQTLGAVLNRLVELEASEEEVKAALAYGGLKATHEANVSRRVIKLKFDRASGRMEWHHWAVRSIWFSSAARGALAGRLRDRKQLAALVYFNDADQIVGWDLPPD